MPDPAELHPAEQIALTVARAQLKRGENPPIGVTTMLAAAIDRLTGVRDWTEVAAEIAATGDSGGG